MLKVDLCSFTEDEDDITDLLSKTKCVGLKKK